MENIFFQTESLVSGTRLQTPPRGLIGDEAERVSASLSGDLEEPRVAQTFQTVDLGIRLIPIREIIHFDGIQDYRRPTSAERPIVVQTPLGYFCIEGWHLVEAAAMDGQETISCEVEVLAQHSDAEISIRKASSRIATRGGIALYPEMIRNTLLCDEQLRASNSDLRCFGRGGRRFGEGFVDDSEKDIVHILSLRFMRDRDTITTYLHHGKHLSNEALQTLIDEEAPKKFFEKHQTKKQRLIDELEEQRATEIEKVERVSVEMLEFFEEWREAQRQGNRSSRRVVQQENPTPPAPEPVPEDEGEDREEGALSESGGSGDESPDQLADGDEGESDEGFSEPEEDQDENLTQSSSDEVNDEGVITDEEDDEDEPSDRPHTMEREDVHEALLAVAERLTDLPDMNFSRIELIESIREEIVALTDLVRRLERIED